MRILLGLLLVIVAVLAFGGGSFGFTNPTVPPVEWLAGTPFPDYRVPGALLVVVVGGSWLTAGILVLRRSRLAREGALLAGVIMVGWIAVQVAIIGYQSWMQPAMLVTGLLVIALGWQLRGRAPAR